MGNSNKLPFANANDGATLGAGVIYRFHISLLLRDSVNKKNSI